MSVKSVDYLANLAANTERGPTEALWAAPDSGNAWVEDFIQSPRLGMYFWDDFLCAGTGPGAATVFQGSLGQWSLYQGSNSGTFQDGGIIGGGLQFVPSSGTVSTGASNTQMTLSSQAGAFQITTASTNASCLQGRLAFECRVMLTSVTAGKRDAFVGLADQGTPSSNNPFTVVSAGSSQMLTTTRNLIGFYNAGSGRGQDWAFVFQLASTAPVFCSNLGSLVSIVTGSAIAAGTFYKLGFVYDPVAPSQQITTASDGQTVGNTARAMIKVYVNGIAAAAFLTQTQNILTASFPTGIMGPIAAFANVSNSGTSNSGTNLSGLFTLDWMRIAQNLEA
jgi:hypothetical protein